MSKVFFASAREALYQPTAKTNNTKETETCNNNFELWSKTKTKKRHNGPKALSALTNSMPLVQSRNFNKFGNLGQNSACFCLAKGQEYMLRMAADVSIAIAIYI